jgi:hypothetical protein
MTDLRTHDLGTDVKVAQTLEVDGDLGLWPFPLPKPTHSVSLWIQVQRQKIDGIPSRDAL